jgi:hypothetical protein
VRAPASGFAPSESESESETQPQTQPPDPAVLTAGQLRDLFRKTWLTHRSIDPPFPAEAELDDLAERVVNAAAIRRLPPAQLFTSALEHWARSELNPREKRSPVQCFAQAFGEVVDQVVTSLPVTPSAHDLLVKRSAEAVRVRNFDLYNELQAELRAMNGSGHAP